LQISRKGATVSEWEMDFYGGGFGEGAGVVRAVGKLVRHWRGK